MTREEMRRRILHVLNDDPDTPIFWAQEEIHQLLQEAQEVFAEEVTALTQTVHIPVRPGKMFYPLGGLGVRCMTPWRLWSRSRQHRLWPISMQELTGHYERWLTVTGDPEWWGLLSWDTIFVWPAAIDGGGTFELDCFVWPTPLLDDHDIPIVPDSDHEAFVEHVEVEGHVKQADIQGAVERAQRWMQRAKDGQARAGMTAMQERFFTREVISR